MGNIIESIESEVSKLLKESTEKFDMAVAEYDEWGADWYAGEKKAYKKVFDLIEKLKEKDLETPKRVIGYDDFGKPLHEGVFCTFDVDVTDWNDIYIPDSIRKVKTGDSYKLIAKLEGKIVYNDMDKCYELSIDNDYCPALYFHAIEPGSLRLDDSSKENKVSIREARITPSAIIFHDFEEDYNIGENTLITAYLEETDELDKIMGIYTKDTHIDAFMVNYYGRKDLDDNFDVIACVTVYDEKLLKESFSDIADRVIKLANTYKDIEPVVVPLNKEELNIIEEKFNDYYINVYGDNDIER